MTFNATSVNLSEIDTADVFYRISTGNDIDTLARSIKAIGLINMPFLERTESGYRIICGFKRVMASKMIGCKKIAVNVIGSNENIIERTKLAISDNSFQRALNLLEQSRAINLLSNAGVDDENYPVLAELLNLPVTFSDVKRIKPLCQLSKHIRQSFISEHISHYMALELGKLSPDTSRALSSFFNTYKMSFSKQKEILGLLNEIARRDDTTIIQVLNCDEITGIMDNSELDGNLKVSRIRQCLKKLRFPSITDAENAFLFNVKELQLPNSIKLIPPHGFEGANYSLSLNFKSIKELAGQSDEIIKLLNKPCLKNILD
ncbi:MAG: ParB/RepB/Spo0J family partition protein [Desulfobacterales bacterium]|nr:ParB/RepB/Spo0J family partition protein [Desulfobacterales bacterium]